MPNGTRVVVTEHDLDVIAEADWVVELDPESDTGVALGPMLAR
jgi:excinuclease UvrABC ATPase subunit